MHLGKFSLSGVLQGLSPLSSVLFYGKCLICVVRKSLWMRQFSPKGLETAGRCGKGWADPGLMVLKMGRIGSLWLLAAEGWTQGWTGRPWGHSEMSEAGSSLHLSSILGGFKSQGGFQPGAALPRQAGGEASSGSSAYLIVPVTVLAHLNTILPWPTHGNWTFL